MPLYEYYCSDCRAKFELLLSYAASQSDIVCAKCHGTQVRKVFSVVARSHHGEAAEDAGEYGSESDSDGDEEDFSGGCACGGACACQD